MEVSIKEFGVRKQVQNWLLPCPVGVNTQVVQVSKLSAPVSRALPWNKPRTQGRQSGNTQGGNADPTDMSTAGEELPGSTLTESHTPFFLPIGQDSTSWGFSFLAAQPHRTKQLHIPHHPSRGWCLILGHHQRNRGSWSLSLFFLASEPAKFKSES